MENCILKKEKSRIKLKNCKLPSQKRTFRQNWEGSSRDMLINFDIKGIIDFVHIISGLGLESVSPSRN